MSQRVPKDRFQIFDPQIDTLTKALLRSASLDDVGVSMYQRNGNIEKRSFNEINDQSRKWSSALHGLYRSTKPTVAIILPSGHELIQAFFAIQLSGGIPFCLPTKKLVRMSSYAANTASLLKAAKCQLIITDEEYFSSLEESASLAQAQIIRTQYLEQATSTELCREHEANDIAMIQFSSGTTVDPKPIALTHQNIITNVGDILSTFPDDLYTNSGCSWLPLHHDMGLIGCLFTAVFGGGDLTLIRPEDFVVKPSLWLQALTNSKATISPCPTFGLKMCTARVKDEELADLDLSNWKMALIGAENVQYKALSAFAEKFASCGFRFNSFTPVYGLAEATLAVTFSDTYDAPKMLSIATKKNSNEVTIRSQGYQVVSVGKPLPNCEVKVVDSEGNSVSNKVIGHVLIRGKTISQQYLDRAMPMDNQGWLDTGDLGFFYQNELYIHGRSKDIIIMNGRNHDPSFIERSIDQIKGIQSDRSAAFAYTKPETEEETFILVVEISRRQNKAESLLNEIKRVVLRSTGLIAYDIFLVDMGSLPRTTSGKIRRQHTRELWQNGELIIITNLLARDQMSPVNS